MATVFTFTCLQFYMRNAHNGVVVPQLRQWISHISVSNCHCAAAVPWV